jgi:hypothetical protein
MLELGKAGTAGVDKHVVPVLADGVVVGTLRSSTWKEAATAVIDGQDWVFARRKGALTGRRAADPEDTARLTARRVSAWKSAWTADLEGTTVEVRTASAWAGTHRVLIDGWVVAESGKTGSWWSPRPTLDVQASLPRHHQAFLLWLELVRRRRVATATATAAGGGAS